jgi:O-antigen ligase
MKASAPAPSGIPGNLHAPLPSPSGWSTASEWSFLLFVACLGWAIAPMSITVALCVALTVPFLLRPASLAAARTPVELPAFGWILALVLSAAFAVDPATSFGRVTKGFMPLLVLLASHQARTSGRGRRAVAVLLLAGAVAACVGLGTFIVHGASMAARARGPVGHYMTFAGQLLLFVSLAAGILACAKERRWRLGALGASLVGSAALAATFTRSAWIGLAVALTVILAGRRPRWVPALLAGVLVLFALAPAPYRARALSAFDPHHPTNRERTYMWEAGVRMFRDHPLTGVGLQDMKPVYDRYKSPEAHERAGHLHSVPVQIGASMGLVGLLAFGWLYASLAIAATRGLRPALPAGGLAVGVRLGVAAGLTGFLVAGLFEWNFGDEELLYLLFTLVGIAWAARNWTEDSA